MFPIDRFDCHYRNTYFLIGIFILLGSQFRVLITCKKIEKRKKKPKYREKKKRNQNIGVYYYSN